jgi:Nitrate and nitrite sensing/Histidine kinase-, DNA gyrase B-, and HSP90-like ATPase
MVSDQPGRATGDARPAAGTQLARDRRPVPAGKLRRAASRSIRLRLLLPVLVATVGLVALGIQQSLAAVSLADQGGTAETVAATAVATVNLEYQLEHEIAETDALHQRDGATPASWLTAAREQTDLAVTDFRAISDDARRLSPAMRPLLDSAGQQLDALAGTRDQVGKLTAGQLSAASYAPVTSTLIAIADALPQQISDAVLAGKARALVALVADEHLGAQQRDLLRQVFVRHGYAGSELTQLAGLVGQQQERRAAYDRNATAGQRDQYQQAWDSEDGRAATKMLTGALSTPAQLSVDADVWYLAQSNALGHLHELQAQLSDELGRDARSQQSLAQTKALVTAVSTIGLMVLAMGTALLLAVRTSRRLHRLRAGALGVAQVELPAAIAELSAAGDENAIREALRRADTRVDHSGLSGADEITAVGQALGHLHRQALHLAADQAALRLDVAALFVALSRRGQTLVQRQLHLIDDFERNETDPHRLSRLFSIDHLAARMRRNEENLLVLAGGEPGKGITSVVPLLDLVRAAAAEIEDYARVDPVELGDVGIVPTAARDLIHLLAELLENATFFSPPSRRVRVTTRRDIEGLQISVYDEGIGMTAGQLAEANARLAGPAQLTAELAGTMGLLVVSRLAARHSIGVTLRSAHRGGTVALVQLPNALLAPAPSLTEHTEAMLRRSVQPGDVLEGEVVDATQELPRITEPIAVGAGGTPEVGRPDAPAAADHRDAARPAPHTPPGPVNGAGGLPHRQPGGLLLPGAAVDAEDLSGTPRGARPPDPELVRARLAGLASGLAAAARHIEPDPDAPHATMPAATMPPATMPPATMPVTPRQDGQR